MLLKISRAIDKANALLGKTVAYFTLLMATIMCAVVVLRYGFNIGWIAMQESITYLHAAVFLLGSAFTYQQNGHVRVDVFYRRFSHKTQTIIDLVGALLFMLPVALYITWVCWDYVAASWRLLEGSRESGGLPFVYILKSLLLVFSISLSLQALSEVIKQGVKLVSGETSEPKENTQEAQL